MNTSTPDSSSGSIWLKGLFLAALLVLPSACPARAADGAEGKKLYLLKCAKCHKLYDPKSYTDEEWDSWMVKMKQKAHLDDRQYALIRGYLDGLRRER